MKLSELRCVGVRGLADGTYTFNDPRTGAPRPVVLVTGGLGAGKTTLLEAIAAVKEAAGAYGAPPDPRRFRRPGAGEARISATWYLSEPERVAAALDHATVTVTWDLASGPRAEVDSRLRRLFSDFQHAKLEYFPTNRAMDGGGRGAFGAFTDDAFLRVRATKVATKYAGIAEKLRELHLRDAARTAEVLATQGVALRQSTPDSMGPYKDAVLAVAPDLRLVGVDLNTGLRFVRRSREEIGVDELSDGERQVVLFALAYRALALDGALVLVDEPELHIHAAHRARLLHALIGLGPDNQLIVATGAKELVSAADPGQVIDLSAPTRGEVRA